MVYSGNIGNSKKITQVQNNNIIPNQKHISVKTTLKMTTESTDRFTHDVYSFYFLLFRQVL